VRFARRAAALSPGVSEASKGLGRALHQQANFYFWSNRLGEAEKLYLEEIPLQEARLAALPERSVRHELGAALMGLADVYFWQSRLELALKTYDRACKDIYAETSRGATALDDIAICDTRRADALAWLERYGEAEQLAGKAVAIYAPMLQADPGNLTVANAYSIALNKQGEILAWQQKFDQALAAYSTSLEIAQRLYLADPTDLRSARAAALALNKRGDVYMETKRYRESIVDYQSARKVFELLRMKDPANTEHERDLALSGHRIGVSLVLSGDRAAAAPYFQSEADIMRKRWQLAPKEALSRRDLAVALEDLVELPAAPAQICAWWVENRDLLRSLQADGVATPTDIEQLGIAEGKAKTCPASVASG
jgi:tetratricopeptide (TPR) repeat protein